MAKRATILLAGLLCGAISGVGTARAAESTPVATSEAQTAVVRVTVEANGQTLRGTKVVEWGSVAQFDLGGHALELTVTDREHVAMTYRRDGSSVSTKQLSATPRQSLVLHDADGIKITAKIIPTRVHIETQGM